MMMLIVLICNVSKMATLAAYFGLGEQKHRYL